MRQAPVSGDPLKKGEEIMEMKKVASEKYQLYINGKWVDAKDGKTIDSYCPANGEFLASMADAAKEDVDAAVDAAWAAFPAWKETTPVQRRDALLAIADIMEKNKEKLSWLECEDTGKPKWETDNGDLPATIEHYRYMAGACCRPEGEAKMLDPETMTMVLHEPIGVAGQIIPWNYPLNMMSWKIAPALAAGCCIVLKPSCSSCLAVIEFVKMIDEAKILPPGVLNLVTGKGSTAGQFLLDNQKLSKLAFTGSTEIGRNVALAAAKHIIPATVELGGKSAVIIFDDAKNIDQVVEGVQKGILSNIGQICCAGSRVLVQDTIYDLFVEKAVAAFNKVAVGTPWDPKTRMGSLNSQEQKKKVMSYFDIAKKEGAKILCGGTELTENGMNKGAFVAPTLIEAKNNMRVAQEEIFGPVAVVIKFKTEQEAIDIANDSCYGLGGSVWTSDINKGIRVSRGVRTGTMWINRGQQGGDNAAPFGGYKQSGYGRETHWEAISNYTVLKSIRVVMHEKPYHDQF